MPMMSQRTEQANRPRGNQSSIAGGIFGGENEMAPPPSARESGNKSNQSSIAGGIFGEGPAAVKTKPNGNRGNQSSIPGGIFG